MSKMIPALIYKSEENEYEVQVYQLDSREVIVRDLFNGFSADPLTKILNDEISSQENYEKIISSAHIQPKSRVVEKSVTIKVTNQPKKKVIYCNSIEIYRGFKAENLPYIKVLESGDKDSITWKSSVSFDLQHEAIK